MLRIAIPALLASACSFTPPDTVDDELPGGPTVCEPGTHACGTECAADQPNTPDVGCSQGCGVACPSAANANAACSAGGTCELRCAGGFAEVSGECVPGICEQTGFTCGAFVDEAGTSFECGSCEAGVACGTDHECAIGDDAHEPNDSVAAARNLGDFNDASNRVLAVDDLTIANGDEDWFRFHITDGLDGGNPIGLVELRTPLAPNWLASDHELTVWFACDASNAGTRLSCGEGNTAQATNTLSDPVLGVGCTTNARQVVWALLQPSCSGAGDGGTVTIRVRKLDAPRGDRYTLRAIVE